MGGPPDDAAMTMRESGSFLPVRRVPLLLEWASAVALGLLMAVLGPYGTYGRAELWERLLYWPGLMLVAFLLYRPAVDWAEAAARRRKQPPLAGWAAAVLTVSVPMTLVVWVASFRHTPQPWPNWQLFLDLYPNVLTACGALTALLKLVRRATPSGRASRPAQRSDAERFLDRLPAHLGRDLLALEMEDHYVRAHTARGSTLVLMRMRDAADALAGLDGVRVHRSWWVARSALSGAEREGRSVRLVLRNGLKVPVPRERAPELRRSGWIPSRLAEPAGAEG